MRNYFVGTLQERFWHYVQKTETCWRWTGTIRDTGYGVLATGVGKPVARAHRVSYEIHKGPIPKGLFVCHSCDNRWCVNPEHLWLGDNRANIKDAVDKGRMMPPHYSGKENNNGRKTHCPQGHEYNEQNTYTLPSRPTARYCRRCRIELTNRQREAFKAAGLTIRGTARK